MLEEETVIYCQVMTPQPFIFAYLREVCMYTHYVYVYK